MREIPVDGVLVALDTQPFVVVLISQRREERMVGPKHDTIDAAGCFNGGLQARLAINDGVEVDVCMQNVPDGALGPLPVTAVGDELALVGDARLDPPGQEGQGATGVGQQEQQLGVPVEDAGEVHAGDGDGGLEREAER